MCKYIKKLVSLILAVTAVCSILIVFQSCANESEYIDLEYFNDKYKSDNYRFFPADADTSRDLNARVYTIATEIDPNMSDDYHYVQALYPNGGSKPYFEKHTLRLFELSNKGIINGANGRMYHKVTYHCPFCQYQKYVYILCGNQNAKCDGSCINFDVDLEDIMESRGRK